MSAKARPWRVRSASAQSPLAAMTFQCPDCPGPFSSALQLARHQVRRHPRLRAARSR